MNAAGKLCVSAFCRKKHIIFITLKMQKSVFGSKFIIHCVAHYQNFKHSNIYILKTVKYILKIPTDLSSRCKSNVLHNIGNNLSSNNGTLLKKWELKNNTILLSNKDIARIWTSGVVVVLAMFLSGGIHLLDLEVPQLEVHLAHDVVYVAERACTRKWHK